MLSAWSLETRGDVRADWRSALHAGQILTAITALVSKDPKPVTIDDLVLRLEEPEDEGEDDEEREATPEEIEHDVEVLRAWVAQNRGRKPSEA